MQVHALACRPISTQESNAKLVLSAQLKPRLYPEWYPYGNVMTNSPSCWTSLLTGMELFARTVGDAMKVLWRKN